MRGVKTAIKEVLREFYQDGLRNLRVEDFARRVQVGSMHGIIQLLRCDCGVSFLYRTAVEKDVRRGSLRLIDLEGFPLRHDFAFVWNAGSVFADEAVDASLPVRVYTLNGTTGFGMAGLIRAADDGKAALNYSFSVESDPSVVTAALVSGDCDIAALPTNAAAALYNKTEGKVQVLALNTRGVLYLLTDGTEKIERIADLAGKTVYAPAQNPSFILEALCKASGVDVTIDNSYAQPAELNAAVAAGEVKSAVLPEPMVTVARSQNPALSVALDLTKEWDKVTEKAAWYRAAS